MVDYKKCSEKWEIIFKIIAGASMWCNKHWFMFMFNVIYAGYYDKTIILLLLCAQLILITLNYSKDLI